MSYLMLEGGVSEDNGKAGKKPPNIFPGGAF
jgi:hypothetical protein